MSRVAKANLEPVVEENENQEPKAKKQPFLERFISVPLLKQSIKSNWVMWLILSLGSALIFVIINVALGSKNVFTNIDMDAVSDYVKDENMQWLQVLGLLERMGFSLDRIQVMSQIDLNSVMNDLIYKIAGVLLPMIYVMIVGNKLLAAQVSDGSMAYVLSTPTNRRKVVRTQYLFLLGSLIAMYLIITFGAYLSGLNKGYLFIEMYTLRTILYCFGSFSAMFALAGICFGASAYCNKSTKSVTIGGSACVLAFLCCILGLFGSKVFVSVGVGVQEMNLFNYLTLYTLIDTESMSEYSKAVTNFDIESVATLTWLWKCAILYGVGIITAIIGSVKFYKKDLPL